MNVLFFSLCCYSFFFFFFNDPATTEIYTLSLHDALPILLAAHAPSPSTARKPPQPRAPSTSAASGQGERDRKSTRLNSSHQIISYAVFCLKKKKITKSTYIYKNDARHQIFRTSPHSS